jgi:hypothetical protein
MGDNQSDSFAILKIEQLPHIDKNKEKEKNKNKNFKELDELEQIIDKTYQDLQKMLKQIRELKNKIPRLKNIQQKLINKQDKKDKKKKLSGFYGIETISEDLAEIINVPQNTQLNRVQLVSKLMKTMKDKKLYYEGNKQVFRADDKIKKILNLPNDVNQQTDPRHPNSLSIYTIHGYVSIYLKNQKSKIKN